MKLTRDDYAALERSWITRQIADEAGLYRVPSIEGRDLVGRKGGGDYGGIVFPYRWPGTKDSVLDRLRLDSPPIEAGKAQHKYLTASGSRNRIYFPPCDPALVADVNPPLVITEGEKKCLALWRAALESNGTGKPAFLPIAVAGVWSWKGVVGIATNAKGERVSEKGVSPDFDRIAWMGRKVTILFDANAATNGSVQAARKHLARELTRRGAEVWIADLPPAVGVNGADDYLALFGLPSLLEVLKQAVRYDWRKELIPGEKGGALPILANAITALRSAPDWCGVLAWDEFAMRVVALREKPWGGGEEWTDQEDRRTTEWLQRHGILVKLTEAGQAVQTVAKDHGFHPVRQYLEGLKWDGISRTDDWLTLYAGAEAADLTRAVAARWLTSAVARVFEPGCKADCCLILEGPQGIGKSTALRILGGVWYSDDVAELGTKDAPLGTRGKWILEFAELDSISGRADRHSRDACRAATVRSAAALSAGGRFAAARDDRCRTERRLHERNFVDLRGRHRSGGEFEAADGHDIQQHHEGFFDHRNHRESQPSSHFRPTGVNALAGAAVELRLPPAGGKIPA
jgi:hypothetical protein